MSFVVVLKKLGSVIVFLIPEVARGSQFRVEEPGQPMGVADVQKWKAAADASGSPTFGTPQPERLGPQCIGCPMYV